MTSMTLREPADLLAIVPYLLGFHPQDSLVLVGVRGGAVAFQARTDLPATPGTETALAAHLLDVVVRQEVEAVLLVGYGSPGRVDPLVGAVRRACAARRLDVPGALRTHQGRFWSYGCADPHCCPTAGTPYDVTTSAVAAAATVAGCVALPDRESFARQVEPVETPARSGVRAATDRAATRLAALLEAADEPPAALAAAGRSALSGALDRITAAGMLSDDEIAWLSLLLVDGGPVAERAWREIRRHAVRLSGRPAARALAGGHAALWREVVRRCEPALAATPATLLAWAAWHEGDGILASVAVERALRLDPGHRRARQVDALLRDGSPPPRVRRPARDRRRHGPRAGARRTRDAAGP